MWVGNHRVQLWSHFEDGAVAADSWFDLAHHGRRAAYSWKRRLFDSAPRMVLVITRQITERRKKITNWFLTACTLNWKYVDPTRPSDSEESIPGFSASLKWPRADYGSLPLNSGCEVFVSTFFETGVCVFCSRQGSFLFCLTPCWGCCFDVRGEKGNSNTFYFFFL